MKRNFNRTLVFASLALLSGAAAAQIVDTPHNLTATGLGTNTTTGSDQICVFCHTPHGSNIGVAAPLWNKATTGTTYTTYSSTNSSSIDGSVLTTGSVSLACLSCHDGTQAMDNMFNAPGSGAGVGDGTTGVSQAYTWTGSNKITGIANLGSDLTNDHPIGIEYCGGGITGTTTTIVGTCADLDFRTVELRTRAIDGNQVFWIDVGTAADQRDKQDIILYTRDFTAGGGSGPSVECASCHDPHSSKATTGSDVNFMRVSTDQSEICLACHVK
jgi:predicted CXXCH cytochrome family protein